jgi:hypothetical protein
MADNDERERLDDGDPLQGAVEHDAVGDAFWEAADAVEDSLGLPEADAQPVPNDDAAADDAMP